MKLFVYGTLQRGFGNHRRLADAQFISSGTSVKPYVLFNCGFPMAVPFTEAQDTHPLLPITGEVFEVTEKQLNSCDQLEGHPRWYKRDTIQINTDNGIVDAMIYEMPSWSNSHLSPIVDGKYNWGYQSS